MPQRHTLAAAAAALLLAAGAGWASGAEADRALAYVGGQPVTSSDLEEIAGPDAGDTGPDARLGYAIRHKALVREARRQGVFRNPGYRREMRAARERALVRTLVEARVKELEKTVTVTDEELSEFAARMCYTVVFYEKEFGTRRAAEKFIAAGRAGRPQEWDGEVTVVGCENVGPLMADAVFSLDEGETRLVPRGRRFTVVRLIEKKRTLAASKLPDKGLIRRYLLEKKRAEALEDWMDHVVGEADVRLVEDAPPGAGQ